MLGIHKEQQENKGIVEQHGSEIQLRARWCRALWAIQNPLDFILGETESQRNDMVWLIFKDYSGYCAGNKLQESKSGSRETQVRDDGILDYHRGLDQNGDSKSLKEFRFWICIEGTADRIFW